MLPISTRPNNNNLINNYKGDKIKLSNTIRNKKNYFNSIINFSRNKIKLLLLIIILILFGLL